MPVQKISDMTAITGSDTATDDVFLVVDSSTNVTKKITRAELNNAIEQDVLASIDVTSANIDSGTIDNVTIGGTTAGTGTFTTLNATSLTANGGVNVDNITIDGTEIDLSSGDLTVDVAGDIILDADGGDVFLKDGGTTFGEFTNSSTDFVIKSTTSDKDIIFKGNDGGSAITALTLDMSEAGNASFNASVTTGAELTVGTLFKMPDNTSGKILVGDGTSYQEVALSGDATLASNGAITLSSSAVENSMLAGSIANEIAKTFPGLFQSPNNPHLSALFPSGTPSSASIKILHCSNVAISSAETLSAVSFKPPKSL